MEIKNKKLFILGVVLITIVVGIGATIGTFYFVLFSSSAEKVRSFLHITTSDNGTVTVQNTRTDKVVLEESSAFIDATKAISPAVVSINGSGTATQNMFGFGTIEAPKVSGTGFIITSDGLIATNRHVVSDSSMTYSVTTSDGKTYDAKVAAIDPSNDLALVKVDAKGLSVANLGDSDKVEVGQWVIAVGNALGELQNTVTVGVISAKERLANPTDSSGNVEYLYGLFQTDAAINAGNSGGPLVDVKGNVIGINTAVSSSGQNIGFALPVNDLKKDIDSYRANNKIIQPYIGVRYQQITTALAKNMNLSVGNGALIADNGVISGSPADKAGIKAGDIITKINDDSVSESQPLNRLIKKYSPNTEITATVIRGGKESKIKITLGSSS